MNNKYTRITSALDQIIRDRKVIAEEYGIPYSPPSVKTIIQGVDRWHYDGLYDSLFMDVAYVLEQYIEEDKIRWQDL